MKRLCLMLTIAASLSGVTLLDGCASRQPYTDDGMTEERYRFLYPREHYNSLNSSQQKELDHQALREQAEWQRK